MNNRNLRDRARLLIEAACDEFLPEPDTQCNDKVVELCNFFLYGGKNMVDMASGQLRDFFKSVNPSKANDTADFIACYRFAELVESLGSKYGSVPEGWTEQSIVYAEVSRAIRHILAVDNNLKQVVLGLNLLEHLAKQCHRANNRFVLEALTDEELLRQLRQLWKMHRSKTGHNSMQITESVLRFVQTWRDELVPPNERKRHDPANKTQWSIQSLQASIKSYSSMSTSQLQASAQSAAHWADKRLREATGVGAKEKGLFGGLEECHHKLKKRGADFPQVMFGSSDLLRSSSVDIQRCSENDMRKVATTSDADWAFGQDACGHGQDAFGDHNASNASSSMGSPTTAGFDGKDDTKPKVPLKIKIKAAKMTSKPTVSVSLGAFTLAPPPGSKPAVPIAPPLAPPFTTSTATTAATASTLAPAGPIVDLLDFSFDAPTPAASSLAATSSFDNSDFGNPFADSGNSFDDPVPTTSKTVVEDDPFAALAQRNAQP